ncbi:unnamed protein product [Closterium sp. NIES-65]|nr:unnamed protein product [Closterium sp. NIES-65]
MKLSHWSSAARMLQTPTQQVTLSGAGTPLRFFFRWPWVCSLLPCLNQWLPLSSLALHFKSQFPLQLAPTTALSLALCVRIAGGGEGCGVNTDAPSRPSPVAVQGGGTWMRAAGGGAAAALSSPSRYQLSAGNPLRCRSPSQVQVPLSGAGPPLRCRCRSPSQVQVPLSGAGPPLRCRSPSQVQVPLSGAGPPLRCRCRFPSQVQVPLASVACALALTSDPPFLFHIWQWRGGALGSTPTLPRAPPLWPCRDLWGPEGGSTAAWQSHYSKGEYRDGLGLSRSLAMQQRQLTGPVVAASAAGSADAAGEGRGEGDIRRHLLALLQLPAKCFRLPGLTLACFSLLMLNYSCPFHWPLPSHALLSNSQLPVQLHPVIAQSQALCMLLAGGGEERWGQHRRLPAPLPGCSSRGSGGASSSSSSSSVAAAAAAGVEGREELKSTSSAASGGRGVWVDANTPPRPSLLAVQVPTGMGGRQHCSSLQLVPQGRVLGWAGLSRLKVGALEQGQESGDHPLTHLLLSPFSLPSQQHPAWTTVEYLPPLIPLLSPLPSSLIIMPLCTAVVGTGPVDLPFRLGKGLPEDLRDQLSVVVIAPRDLADSDDQCPICLTDYEVHDVQQRQPCGHHFHQPCLDAWFTSHTTCPVCRVQLTLQPDNPEKDQQGAGTSAVGVAVPGSIT